MGFFVQASGVVASGIVVGSLNLSSPASCAAACVAQANCSAFNFCDAVGGRGGRAGWASGRPGGRAGGRAGSGVVCSCRAALHAGAAAWPRRH